MLLEAEGLRLAATLIGLIGAYSLIAPRRVVWFSVACAFAFGFALVANDAVILCFIPLVTLQLIYVLAQQYTRLSDAWLRSSARVTAVLAVGAGGLALVSAIWAGVLAALCWLIILSHLYNTLNHHNRTQTLTGHWAILSALWLAGGVLVLALASSARLMWLANHLILMGAMAACLGVINLRAAAQRGEDRRITGLIPFWLIALSTTGGGLALLCAGVSESILRGVIAEASQVDALLRPLDDLWRASGFAALAGWATFGLGVVARFPQRRDG